MAVFSSGEPIDNLDDGEAAMADKGYDGVASDYPDKRQHPPYSARRNRP